MNREERFAALEAQPFRRVGQIGGRERARSFQASLRDLVNHRNMLALFVRRDLKSRYKDSALGFTWTLVRPITQLLIYWIVVGKFLGAERGIPNFAIYIFTGLVAFGLFQEIVTGSTGAILSNAGLVKKVYVPRELFPLAATGTAIFNFLIQFGILLIACLILQNFYVSWDLLYLLPGIFILIIFGLAFGLALSAWNVYLRDVSYLVDVFVMLLLWASPILYSWQMVRDTLLEFGAGWLLEFYTNNPITLAVLSFQKAIWGTNVHGLATPDLFELRLLVALLVGIVLLYAAQRLFARLQGNFAQEL